MTTPVRDLSRGIDPSVRRRVQEQARGVRMAHEALGEVLDELEMALIYSWEFSPGASPNQNPGTTTAPASQPPPGWNPDRPDRDWHADLSHRIATARHHMDQLTRTIIEIMRRNEAHRGREQTTDACKACNEPIGTTGSPSKAGCCVACYQWTRDEADRRRAAGLADLDYPELVHRRRTNLAERQEQAS